MLKLIKYSVILLGKKKKKRIANTATCICYMEKRYRVIAVGKYNIFRN